MANRRIDPFYYQNHYRVFQNQLSGLNNVESLADLLQLIGSGKRPEGGVANIQSGILSFGGEHINDQCEIEVSTPRYISREFHSLYNKTETRVNDLLLVKDGATTGKIGIVSRTEHIGQNINEHLFLLRAKVNVNPVYLLNYLNSSFGKLQIQREITGATVTGITRDVVKRLKVILPPPNIQNHIANFTRSAYAQKNQKEQEADALLDSIDDYVLTELGIEIPQHTENSIENRVFTATLSELSGRRFDPEMYYQVYSLQTKHYPMERFQNCVFINPLTSFKGYELDTSITFVPMEKVSAEYGDADLSLCKVIEKAKGYTRFRNNDLIWAKITPCMENGKSAVVNNLKESIGCGSTEFHVFRALGGINIHYIHALLRLKSLRKHAALHFTGSAGQQRVSSEFFKELVIPKPSIEKQTEIANYIIDVRNRAKRLQQEADAIVEAAKERVERMLLQ